MKKYNLILSFTAVMLAILLSACEDNNGTRTVIYTEPYPQLTSMTQITTTPADTYSEYMATYTTTETGTPNYFAIPSMYGVGADTFGTSPETAVTAAPVTDTAVTIPPVTETIPATETIPSAESVSETEYPSGTEGSSETKIPESSVTTRYLPDTPAALPELPAADTVNHHIVQTDTAPTVHSETYPVSETYTDTSNTSNGGTDNAN